MNTSSTTRIARWLIGAAALAALSGTAAARDNVSLSISIGAPLPVYAAPVYAPPMYVPPPAPAYVSAYVASAPVYLAPAYVAQPPRVAYYPAPGYGPRWHGHGHGWGHGRHGWR